MAASEQLEDSVRIPEGVMVTVDPAGLVSSKGPKGEAHKLLRNPSVAITVEGDVVLCRAKRSTLREKKMVNTFSAHVRNIIKGVQDGFTYKLKICSSHFPMTVTVKGSELVVKNLFGEAVPRVLALKEGAKVSVAGDIIEVSGTNKETVGQVSADIENLVRRVDYDRRIFQDGIYIIEKDNKKI